LQPNVQIYREFLILLQSLIIIKNNLKGSKLVASVSYRNAARDDALFNENEMQPRAVGEEGEEQMLVVNENDEFIHQPVDVLNTEQVEQAAENSSQHSVKSDKLEINDDLVEVKEVNDVQASEKVTIETRSHSSRSRPKSRPQTGSTTLHRQPSTIIINDPDQEKQLQ
jgi:hypothetical protein